MWRFEDIKNYATAFLPESFKKKIIKKLDYEGEAREMVAGKKPMRLREGLVGIF